MVNTKPMTTAITMPTISLKYVLPSASNTTQIIAMELISHDKAKTGKKLLVYVRFILLKD